MQIHDLYTNVELHRAANDLFAEERRRSRLDGWFIAKEIERECAAQFIGHPPALRTAETLCEVIRRLPISISDHAIFAGTQRDAFARSYALINPTFKVSSFSGYCDPTAVFDDIQPNDTITAERIESLRQYFQGTEYIKALNGVYDQARLSTSEAVFFIEQVTGHLVPDFQPAISGGLEHLIGLLDDHICSIGDDARKSTYEAMKVSLEAALILAERYAQRAHEMAADAEGKRKQALELMETTLRWIPRQGARNLYEAIQAYILLWQVMCLEQAPNPFAFSVGNADRIFEPYRAMDQMSREWSAGLFKHFLVFFNIGDRSWAISQNVIVGGKSSQGRDLTNQTTYALLDAYFEMNLPQPILSVKLHKDTPDELYQSLGRFYFSPGCLTPSFFNDDSLFVALSGSGIERDDLENYAIAGCQEPLIMGKDNGNTTNSWLNLAKILELCLNNGISTVTGKKIGPDHTELGFKEMDEKTLLVNIRDVFYKNVAHHVDRMVEAANDASRAVSLLPVPFLSTFMGGLESGIDLRSTTGQGTKYNASGCLIHGLSIIADSLIAIDTFLQERPAESGRLLAALKTNFAQDEELRQYLLSCPKYGNNMLIVDQEARDIALRVCDLVSSRKNYLGNPFRPDWSSPTTHLLYGYWVGATPDGRNAREMLGYGIDPLFGEAQTGLGFRVLSNLCLPFERMNGGYASHFGIDPHYFSADSHEEKGLEFKEKVITPLFFNANNQKSAPFYLYVNVTTPEILRKVLENPQKYAPSGVYIMRIHGTFVNFLDLSPEIQEDIIKRLDLKSTRIPVTQGAVMEKKPCF